MSCWLDGTNRCFMRAPALSSQICIERPSQPFVRGQGVTAESCLPLVRVIDHRAS